MPCNGLMTTSDCSVLSRVRKKVKKASRVGQTLSATGLILLTDFGALVVPVVA